MGNNPKPEHHKGTHHRLSKRVRAWANSHPEHRCERCGMTRAEGVARWGDEGEWEAGHVIDGDSSGGYRPEHRHGNRSAGATLGNARRSTGYHWP
jgi:hypothetical protein